MYERFYHLRERPFSLSPNPAYFYPSRVHKEALSYLRYGLESHAGFIVITGEAGSGKTTLLQTVLRGLDRQTSISRLVNTLLDPRELIEAVMLDFGLEPGAGRGKPHLLRDLARFLVEQRSAGRLALLVIDEAQNLSLAALEEVRMLSNLETEESKLVQIALVGQPRLREVLGRPELAQLRQRVTVRYHLQTLSSEETAAYINHRLRRAAIDVPLEFSRDVTDLIHLYSQGLPRKINVIADAVLLFGYGEERRIVDVELAQLAIEELEATEVLGSALPGPAFDVNTAASDPAPRSTSANRPERSASEVPRQPESLGPTRTAQPPAPPERTLHPVQPPERPVRPVATREPVAPREIVIPQPQEGASRLASPSTSPPATHPSAWKPAAVRPPAPPAPSPVLQPERWTPERMWTRLRGLFSESKATVKSQTR